MSGPLLQFPVPKGVTRTPRDAWASVRDDFEVWLLTHGCSKDTVRTHVANVDLYARWCREHHVRLITATEQNLSTFIAEQLGRVSRSTAMNRLLACRSFYRFLVAARRRTTDPTAHIPVKRDKLQPIRPYSMTELSALVDGASRSPCPELLPIMLLLIGSACRRAEIMNMKTEDIDWARGRILIRGKGSKERWVQPGQTAMRVLSDYVAGRQGKVWSITAHALYKLIHDLGVQVSVVGAHPHRFRRTFAHQFLKRKGNLLALKEIMGHDDLKTTEIYANWEAAENALAMQGSLDLASEFAPQQRRLALVE